MRLKWSAESVVWEFNISTSGGNSDANMCEDSKINAFGWWMRSRWECALYVSRVKGRRGGGEKKNMQSGGEKKNTTNPKQNADGSCADSPLSALWQALLYFTWVSSLVLILLSLPSYLSISHSLASSISWLINQPLCRAVISPATLHHSLKRLSFWPFPPSYKARERGKCTHKHVLHEVRMY